MRNKPLLWILCAACCGCALPTASLRQLEPTRINSLPRRLAVLDVGGPANHATLAHSTFTKRLSEFGFYTLTAESELQQTTRDPLRNADQEVNVPNVLAAARHLGIDAVLLTKLELVEKDNTLYGTVSLPIGEPQVTTKIQYELINARTGATMEQDTIASDTFRGKLQSQSTGSDHRTQILAGLARQASNRLAQQLAPHTSTVKVELAATSLGRGSELFRKGNVAAQSGNWDRAADLWVAALERNPRNHAAWYNLGLALDAMQQFARAKDAYQRALNIRDRSLYREGLARSEQAAGQFMLAMAQRFDAPPEGGGPSGTRLASRTVSGDRANVAPSSYGEARPEPGAAGQTPALEFSRPAGDPPPRGPIQAWPSGPGSPAILQEPPGSDFRPGSVAGGRPPSQFNSPPTQPSRGSEFTPATP